MEYTMCPDCKGTGRIRWWWLFRFACRTCRGSGKVENYNVESGNYFTIEGQRFSSIKEPKDYWPGLRGTRPDTVIVTDVQDSVADIPSDSGVLESSFEAGGGESGGGGASGSWDDSTSTDTDTSSDSTSD